MAEQTPSAAVLSKTIRFLAAGGLTLAIAIIQEIAKQQTDWTLVSTMVAGVIIGIGGGAYGRVVAQGPVTSVFCEHDKGGAA